jgi:hypothetical protein
VSENIEDEYPNDYNIAMIVNNEIVAIFNVDGQEASWFLANPTFLTLSKAKVGSTYKDGNFFFPEK